MDGLIKSSDSKYDEYESLLLERDQVQKEAGQIWTAYLQQFGKAITDVYEEKLKCVKCKKTIAFYQSALNRGGDVDPNAMTEYLEKEMAEYYSNLDWMIRENEEANNSGTSSPFSSPPVETIAMSMLPSASMELNSPKLRRFVSVAFGPTFSHSCLSATFSMLSIPPAA